MTLRPLNPARARRSPFHSQGVAVTDPSRWVYVAGQVGVRPDGAVGPDVVEQTAIAFDNVAAVLAEGGLGLSDVVQLRIYVTARDHIGGVVAGADGLLPAVIEERPGATLLIVPELADPRLLVQIEAVAAR